MNALKFKELITVIDPCPKTNYELLHGGNCPLELATHRSNDGSYLCDTHGHPVVERAVCALIFDKTGKVLSVTRNDDLTDLGLPGGKVERSDNSDWAAVAREVVEETGLKLGTPIPLFTAWDSAQGVYVVTTFTGQVSDLEKIKRETVEGVVQWVWPASLVERQCTFRDYNKKLFKHLGIPT